MHNTIQIAETMKTEELVGEVGRALKEILPFAGFAFASMLALTAGVLVFADEPGSWAWPFFLWGTLAYALLGIWTMACLNANDQGSTTGQLTATGLLWWVVWLFMVFEKEPWDKMVYDSCDYWIARVQKSWKEYRQSQEEFRTRTTDPAKPR